MENTFGKNIIPKNDGERVKALRKYQILDLPSGNAFDYVAQLAAEIFQVPVSLISLVDTDQVYFKANVGMGDVKNSPRGISLCSLAILSPEVTVFENAPEDPCLLTNPNVAGEFGLKFYAGAPLITPDGFQIGTVCVIDKKPRTFSDQEKTILKGLAKLVMQDVELRLTAIEKTKEFTAVMEDLASANEEIGATNEELASSVEELNAINEELLQSQENLKQANSGLEQRVAERTNDLEAANEEMAAANEELVVTNEELMATSDELSASRERLLVTFKELEDSEQNTRNIVANAPFPIAVYTGREMRITMANHSIMEVWGKGNNVIGKLYTDILPELSNQEVFSQLDQVFTTGITFHARNQRIDLMVQGKIKSSYFNYSFTALTNKAGEIYGVMNTAADVTDVVLAKMQVELSEQNLHNMIRQAPVGMCILKGQPLMAVEMNDAFLEIIGKEREIFKTIPYWVVNAEAAPYYEPITDNVFATGEPYNANEHEITLIRKGIEEIVHVDFVYEPIKDIEGKMEAIMILAIEVTDKVTARKVIEHVGEELAAVNEELAASNEEMLSSNEELAAVNEELTVTNEELYVTQSNLQHINKELELSESRFRSLVQEAPVAIVILKGRQLIIETMNNLMLKMLGKNAGVIGKPFAEAMPEFAGQSFLQILDDVFVSGEIYYGSEVKAKIEHDGLLKEGYYNFVYQPIKDESGAINGIICVAADVTGQVKARLEVERAEESLRMAVDAAELASYSINVLDRIFTVSPRLKEFFGFEPEEEVPYEAAINQIHPDYRQAVAEKVETAIIQGTRFDTEYPVIAHNDGQIRWVRGIGTVQQDHDGVNRYFTGVLHDITERKLDDLRKNDFIGMVSHELKTPLTSLTAIVQVLNVKFKNNEDAFIAGALDKANTQVKKMGNMINGFLNVSRLESGKILIEKQPFNLERLIEDIIGESELTLPAHLIRLAPCEPVIVNADQDKIASVVTNLISNAVKYSPKGTTINIKCELEGNFAQVSIKDKGMGIKPQDKEKLFERYYRVDNSNTRHISGFGIGLYLSAEIIHRHNGEIWVESEIGNGSTFYFSLPLNSQL